VRSSVIDYSPHLRSNAPAPTNPGPPPPPPQNNPYRSAVSPHIQLASSTKLMCRHSRHLHNKIITTITVNKVMAVNMNTIKDQHRHHHPLKVHLNYRLLECVQLKHQLHTDQLLLHQLQDRAHLHLPWQKLREAHLPRLPCLKPEVHLLHHLLHLKQPRRMKKIMIHPSPVVNETLFCRPFRTLRKVD
jgi:hypothetical protein